jgi:hypothetical protein
MAIRSPDKTTTLIKRSERTDIPISLVWKTTQVQDDFGFLQKQSDENSMPFLLLFFLFFWLALGDRFDKTSTSAEQDLGIPPSM